MGSDMGFYSVFVAWTKFQPAIRCIHETFSNIRPTLTIDIIRDILILKMTHFLYVFLRPVFSSHGCIRVNSLSSRPPGLDKTPGRACAGSRGHSAQSGRQPGHRRESGEKYK